MKILERLRFGTPGSVVIVAAHPDDEVIGAAAQLLKWRKVTFVHLTDGTPQDLRDVLAAGFCQRADYAKARHNELIAALNIIDEARQKISIPGSRTSIENFELGLVDQETAFHLVQLVCCLQRIFLQIHPDVVITHPYEGGHPDHDSAAFAVDAACQLMQRDLFPVPEIIEMTSYHSQNGEFVSGKFLPSGLEVVELKLSESERAFKRELFECFATQRRVLEKFGIDGESFRVAPAYDFAQLPHEGALYYERFDWNVTGARWRYLARNAAASLGLENPGRNRHSKMKDDIVAATS